MRKIILSSLLVFAVLFIFIQIVRNAYGSPANGQTGGVRDWTHELCANGKEVWDCRNCGDNGPKIERQPNPKPSPSPQPPAMLIPNPAWSAVMGYSQSFSECNSLCNAYRSSGCGKQTAADYCNALFSVDLGKNGNIDGNTYGSTPIGGTTCDTNVHCYDVVSSCDCPGGQSLNLGTCVQILYSSFTNQGFNFVQAYSTISQNLHGNCGTPTPKS